MQQMPADFDVSDMDKLQTETMKFVVIVRRIIEDTTNKSTLQRLLRENDSNLAQIINWNVGEYSQGNVPSAYVWMRMQEIMKTLLRWYGLNVNVYIHKKATGDVGPTVFYYFDEEEVKKARKNRRKKNDIWP